MPMQLNNELDRTGTLQRVARNFDILGRNLDEVMLTETDAHMFSETTAGQGQARSNHDPAKLAPGHGIARAKHQ